MIKSKALKIMLSFGLAAAISLASAGFPLAAEESAVFDSAVSAEGEAEIKSKEEVVYAILDPDGSVRSVYAVNHLAVFKAGGLTDYGDYTSVRNLTDTTPITQNGDAVTIEANAGNFYYQGNMAAAELPWIFDISYSLNGVQTPPQALAGKSGTLSIHIRTRQNTAVNPAFYESYMLQITVTLDTEKCDGIRAPGAAVARAGKDKMLVYTGMPGKETDIAVSAEVKDFAMAGIDVSAMPFSISMSLPDIGGMIDDFTVLSDAIAALHDGVAELADGAAELKAGADQLKSGSSDLCLGLAELSENSGQLVQASSQIGGALAQAASALNGGDPKMDLGSLAQLPQGLTQLAGGLDAVSGGLVQLKSGFLPAYAALDGAIRSIPDAAVGQEQIAALYTQTDPEQHPLLDQLIASYTAGQTVRGTYNQVKGAFDAMDSAIETLSASVDAISASLLTLSSKISDALPGMDQMGQLSAGLSELDKNYTAFHSGLTGYMDGVGALSSGYAGFHTGLSSLGKGVGKLYEGATALRDGTAKLNDETASMPDRIQSEIDGLLNQYTGSDFEPVSFTSAKNGHTELVQFVLKCDGIEKPEEAKKIEAEVKNETFWDRLTALFSGKKDE